MGTEQQGLDLGPPEDDPEVKLVLPWPPTVNTYYKRMPMPPGRDKIQAFVSASGWQGIHKWLMGQTKQVVKLTDRAEAYRNEVTALVWADRLNKGLQGPLRWTMRAYPPDRRERDLDNIYKPLQDALQHAGVYHSDYQIAAHDSIRMNEVVKGGRVEITLAALVY